MTELKPCPFCGGKAQLFSDTDGNSYVECDYCHARSYAWHDRVNAEMLWNSRSIPEDLIAERWEEAQKLLLQAVSNAGYAVTRDKKYDAPIPEKVRKSWGQN